MTVRLLLTSSTRVEEAARLLRYDKLPRALAVRLPVHGAAAGADSDEDEADDEAPVEEYRALGREDLDRTMAEGFGPDPVRTSTKDAYARPPFPRRPSPADCLIM